MQKKAKISKPFPLLTLQHFMKSGKILLKPPYQRHYVWKRSQEQLLIDSLLNELDIPKLYFREISKGGYEYEVVDGQQRLTTIFKFLDGDFALPPLMDPVAGHPTAGLRFQQLHTDLQMLFFNSLLDIVVLNSAYSDEDIEDMFIRLQNGTQLNAAEKRRALAGNMKNVVQRLAQHKIFKLCAFQDSRFAYEDAVAKLLHLVLYGQLTDIRPLSVAKTYETHAAIDRSDPSVKRLEKVFNFIAQAFHKRTSPELKKYSLISLPYAALDLLERYNLARFPEEFATAYLDFYLRKKTNDDMQEEDQDPRLSAYTDAARADSIADLIYRDEMLKEAILQSIPSLVLKDSTRGFSPEQRHAIYLRANGVCACCGKSCDVKEFHADHVVPYANGGETKLSNGQLLCPTCNLQKGDRSIPLPSVEIN